MEWIGKGRRLHSTLLEALSQLGRGRSSGDVVSGMVYFVRILRERPQVQTFLAHVRPDVDPDFMSDVQAH
jgi:hypothetical protein